MRIVFFSLLLLAVVLLAWWRGRTDERMAALTCVAGTIMTVLVTPAMGERFASFAPVSFLVDVAVLLAFLAIALRSKRFWPLWVAGLQLTATTVHLLKLAQPDLMRFVFGAALAFWSYPILLVIGVGAWRTRMIDGWRHTRQLPQPS